MWHADDWRTRTEFQSIALVNGEPTESTPALGTKGAMRMLVRTTGEAAHSAYPHLGRSATRDLVRPVRGKPHKFTDVNYLLQFVTPNVYFHVTTAYDILRHNGVKLGKADFLGALD